jgi:hypothetical protein
MAGVGVAAGWAEIASEAGVGVRGALGVGVSVDWDGADSAVGGRGEGHSRRGWIGNGDMEYCGRLNAEGGSSLGLLFADAKQVMVDFESLSGFLWYLTATLKPCDLLAFFGGTKLATLERCVDACPPFLNSVNSLGSRSWLS